MEAEENHAIRVAVVDDHTVVREGLRLLIESQPGLRFVGGAGNFAEALTVAQREHPEVIVLDLDLGAENGIDIIPELLASSKESKILVLTGLPNQEEHHKAMLCGAKGVLEKDKGPKVLLKAIEKIHSGEVWYDRAKLGTVFSQMLRSEQSKAESKVRQLTEREKEIVGLVSQGLQNKQIAERLFISHLTVRHHLTSIFEKVGVSSRLELILYAFNEGLAKVSSRRDH